MAARSRVPRAPALAALGLALLLLAALPLAAHAQGSVPVVVALDAGYGSEAWKDEAPLPTQGVPSLPVQPPTAALGVYENPYANPAQPHQGSAAWLGYNLTATIELRDAGGAATGTAGEYVGAELQTGAGTIPAKLARTGPARFTAQFDLDGENGASFPAAPPGPASLVVRVYRSSADPTVAPAQVGSAEFPLNVSRAALDRGGLVLPEGDLPGYADVGPGNSTLVQADLVAPGRPIAVAAQLGAPGVPARLVGCHKAACVDLYRGVTDAGGRLLASVDPARLTGNQSGLAMLSASLDGGQGQLASTEVGMVVSTHPTRVASAQYVARAVAGQGLDAADTLVVSVEDLAGGGDKATGGTLHILDPAGNELASQAFDAPSFLQGTTRTATIPASSLPHGGGYYRMVGFLTTEDGRVYSLHQALRGLSASAVAPAAEPFHSATLSVRVRSFQSNLDDRKDAGLALPVHVQVAGLPGNGAFQADVSVDEGGEKVLQVPFSGDAGSYPVTVNATSGELRAAARVVVLVQRAQGGLLGVPGPEPALVVALVALAALHRRRQDA